MPKQIQAKFSVTTWEEDTWDGQHAQEIPAPKQTLARVTYRYQGGLEAEGRLQYLMTYNEDGTGSFVGVERIEGRLDGRPGSFVLLHNGTFDADTVRARLEVAPGSATGDLVGLRATADALIVGHEESYPITFVLE